MKFQSLIFFLTAPNRGSFQGLVRNYEVGLRLMCEICFLGGWYLAVSVKWGSFKGGLGLLQRSLGLMQGRLELILMRIKWLCLEFEGPFGGYPENKSPTIWGLCWGP